MACRDQIRTSIAEMNELESGDNPRVSGLQNPIISDEDRASQSRVIFENLAKLQRFGLLIADSSVVWVRDTVAHTRVSETLCSNNSR